MAVSRGPSVALSGENTDYTSAHGTKLILVSTQAITVRATAVDSIALGPRSQNHFLELRRRRRRKIQ